MKDKLPDKQAMEKITSDISRMLEGQNFETPDEVHKYLNAMIKDGKVTKAPPKNAIQFAQDIMYDAWETQNQKERIKLAREALSISPDCADAYNLLAEETADSCEEARDLYQKGCDAGRRALGEKLFQENDGHFWGYTPTRPYMRARLGLMECLWLLGEHAAAIDHAKAMLELNTNDNQGIRYILIAYLAELGHFKELNLFMNEGAFVDDCAAEWLHTYALLTFANEGKSAKANRALKIAFKQNHHAAEYLLEKKRMPNVLPDRITMGEADEGYCYAYRALKAWKQVSGALEWLNEFCIRVGQQKS